MLYCVIPVVIVTHYPRADAPVDWLLFFTFVCAFGVAMDMPPAHSLAQWMLQGPFFM
jgi:hypothetical protein